MCVPRAMQGRIAAVAELTDAFCRGRLNSGYPVLGAHRMDPRWMQQSLRGSLIWMVRVNGLLVDLRHMPGEVQVIA